MNDPRPPNAALRFAARYATAADFYGSDGELRVAAFGLLVRLGAPPERRAEAVTAFARVLGRAPAADELIGVLGATAPVPPEVADQIRTALGASPEPCVPDGRAGDSEGSTCERV